MAETREFVAFVGQRRVASGEAHEMLRQTRQFLDCVGDETPVLIFDLQTGAQVEFDLRGTVREVLARLQEDPDFAVPSSEGLRPGRPKLGVVSREVSLLPRHWAWLERQPGGCSGTLRRLVEVAMKSGEKEERARNAWEAAGKFMWGMAGNLPNFEEATRALYAKDEAKLKEWIAEWPADIRDQVERMVERAVALQRAVEKAAEARSDAATGA